MTFSLYDIMTRQSNSFILKNNLAIEHPDREFEISLFSVYFARFFFFSSSVAQFREQRKNVAQSPQIARAKERYVYLTECGISRLGKIPASSPGVCFSLQTQNEEDPFYAGCHITKNCFGAPAGCIKTKDCAAVVAVIVQGDEYHFEMQARGEAKYVAVGLSDDKNMVIARRSCARELFTPLPAAEMQFIQAGTRG